MAESNHIEWLRACATDPQSPAYPLPPLGMLTGQDQRALAAIAECWSLYSNSDGIGRPAALAAITPLLSAMQRKCQPFARELIAWAMDWDDRDRLWPLVDPEAPGLDTVIQSSRDEWRRKLQHAVDLSLDHIPDVIRSELYAVSGPSGRVVLLVDGWGLHELYSVLVEPNGPEGCCAGCTRLPEGWCLICDNERKQQNAG